MTPREANYGCAMYAECDAAQPLLDMLGQGDGRRLCAQYYARLSRATKSKDADLKMYPLMHAIGLIEIARKIDGRLSDNKAADLAAFVLERGLGLIERGSVS